MSVCLAIMAKARPEILRRAVDSARELVTSLCLVVAPGDPLMEFESGLPQRTIEQEWLGFPKTRTLLMRYAEGDPSAKWILMMDADDVFLPGSRMPDLASADRLRIDSYEIPVELVGPGYRWRWRRGGHLMRARKGFSWEGTGGSDTQEVLVVPHLAHSAPWDGLRYSNVHDPNAPANSEDARGAVRPGGRTYAEEAVQLGRRVRAMPTDTRAAYYYAQALRDAGQAEAAFEAYAHRARMIGGFEEETFWAFMWMGILAPGIGKDAVEIFHEAHRHSPHRAEPLAAIAMIFRNQGRHDLAMHFGQRAGACKFPTSARSFVDLQAYSREALLEAGIS